MMMKKKVDAMAKLPKKVRNNMGFTVAWLTTNMKTDG